MPHLDFPPPPSVLVADVGGTFARFCLAQGCRPLTDVVTLARASASDLPSLCVRALRDFNRPINGAVIAVAARLSGGRGRMTNADWEVDERTLAQALSVERVLLINDFAALALSLPTLEAGDVLSIPPRDCVAGTGDPEAALDAPRVVFGPGTGLGVAALFHLQGRQIPIASEGGHISFAPATRFEQMVLEQAASRFERVSWERILSGPGLELIDEISLREHGWPVARRKAKQIVDAAREGTCLAATHSVACFAGLLGSFGGDLALMFQASGGVVIGGGIAARIAPLISPQSVRERFCQKGRFSSWLGALPLSILVSPNAALTGAARAFAERFPEPVGRAHD
nr:glucokinase [Rhodoferax sp.]